MLSLHPCSLAVAAMAMLNAPMAESAPAVPHAAEPDAAAIDAHAPDGTAAVHVELVLAVLSAVDAGHLEPLIHAEVDQQLADAGLMSSGLAARGRVIVRVVVLDPSTLDYAIHFELHADDRTLDPPLRHVRCESCSRAQLVAQVAKHLPQALDVLALAIAVPLAAPAEVVTRAEPEAPAEAGQWIHLYEPDPLGAPPAAGRRKARGFGAFGILGILLGIGGMATTGVGLARIAKGSQPEIDPSNNAQLQVRDYGRSGWILYGAGLAAIGVGTTAIAVDVSALYEHRVRRLAMHPIVGRSQAGLHLRGRF